MALVNGAGRGRELLVRLYIRTGDERFAEGAARALRPMRVPVAQGGVLATLDGGPFYEEYPTDPLSHVLNGAIFSLWGLRDVGIGLGDGDVLDEFRQGTTRWLRR